MKSNNMLDVLRVLELISNEYVLKHCLITFYVDNLDVNKTFDKELKLEFKMARKYISLGLIGLQMLTKAGEN